MGAARRFLQVWLGFLWVLSLMHYPLNTGTGMYNPVSFSLFWISINCSFLQGVPSNVPQSHSPFHSDLCFFLSSFPSDLYFSSFWLLLLIKKAKAWIKYQVIDLRAVIKMKMLVLITLPHIPLFFPAKLLQFHFLLSLQPRRWVRPILFLSFYMETKAGVSELICLRTPRQEKRWTQGSSLCFRTLNPGPHCVSRVWFT